MARLDSSAWQRLQPYLEHALDLAPRERTLWMAELAVAEPDIASDLRELLLEHDLASAQAYLEQSPIKAVEPRVGQRIGPYTIDRLLGRGGMGEVWLAIRSDGRFEGTCAIKFLEGALVTAKLAERFRREGQALGRLAHPHIARLLDAGAADDGAPYLALEFVDGQRIDAYADNKQLSIVQRVRLFIDVIAAVAHAHSHLVIHRDLKPSNVLVTADGQVKLLDFGIAKLLGTEHDEALTRVEEAALTPEYAAPEQILGEAPSTATDVYQLGMLLFVLLVGRHPLIIDGSRAGRMRAALDGHVPNASQLAAPSVRRQLSGDLDAILAKALRKLPHERYPTAQALQEEIQRYLNDEPVHARRGATLYRARKFFARHRVMAAAGVLAVAGFAAALVMINEQRIVAERRFGQLRQLSDKVFAFDEAIRNLPGAMPARTQLVSASMEYLEGLAADSAGDVELQETLADAYWKVARIQGVPTGFNLGDTAQADRQLTKAAEFANAVVRARPDDDSALVRALVIAKDRMIVAATEERTEAALMYAQAARDIAESWLRLEENAREKQDLGRIAAALGDIALTFMNHGRYDDAERDVRRQLALIERVAERQAYLKTHALSLLANVLRLQGKVEDALIVIQEARQLGETVQHPGEVERALSLYPLYLREGLILGEVDSVSLNRSAEAAIAFQRAAEINEAIARSDPKDAQSRTRLATASRELSDILLQNDPTRALTVADAALARLSELPPRPATRRSQAELMTRTALASAALGRAAEAERRLNSARTYLDESGDLQKDRVVPGGAVFVLFRATAEIDAAMGNTHRAIAGYLQLLGKVDLHVSNPQTDLRVAFNVNRLYGDLGKLYEAVGDAAAAERARATRAELWRHWDRKLPNNFLIARQLAELQAGR